MKQFILSLLPQLMDVVLKHAVSIVLAIALAISIGMGWQYYRGLQDVKNDLIGTKQQYKQLSETLASVEVKYQTEKDLRVAEEKEWSKEKKDLLGQIKALADVSFSIPSFTDTQDHPDLVTSDSIIQEVHFYDSKTTTQGPPFGRVQIFGGSGKTLSGPYTAEITVDADIRQDKDGKYQMLVKGFYTMNDPISLGASHPELGLKNWVGVRYPLAVTSGSLNITPNSPTADIMKRKFQTAPHLNVGGFVGAAQLDGLEYGVHGEISGWGYGYTKNDLDFKIGAIGTNFSRGYLDLNIVPVSYRIGNHLPLMKDVYLGPGIGFGTEGTSAFLSITTTL